MFYNKPSDDEYKEQDIGYHTQSLHMPLQNFSLPPTAPQGHGIAPHAHRNEQFSVPRCHTRVSGPLRPKLEHKITKCAGIKSYTYDDSWYRNECHIFTI
jgi:hypothetical protein